MVASKIRERDNFCFCTNVWNNIFNENLYIVYNNGTFKNRKNSAKSSSIIIDKNKLCLLLK